MSILTQVWKNLLAGQPPAQVWAQASANAAKWEKDIVSRAPESLQAVATAMTPVVKQGLSDAISLADTNAAKVLTPAAEAVAAAFTTAASAYLGPAASGVLSPVARDGITRIRDMLIAELHAQAMALEAQLSAQATPPVSGVTGISGGSGPAT